MEKSPYKKTNTMVSHNPLVMQGYTEEIGANILKNLYRIYAQENGLEIERMTIRNKEGRIIYEG